MNTEYSLKVYSLRPPEGYMSWLDYAVDTVDVHSVEIEREFADEPFTSAVAMKQIARRELEELRAKVAQLEAQ